MKFIIEIVLFLGSFSTFSQNENLISNSGVPDAALY